MCKCQGIQNAVWNPTERQVIAMAKKNPYVMTIGFNKDDPDHVSVADFLNSMRRGKAQYIVKVVLAYRNRLDDIEDPLQVQPQVFDYEQIRHLVLQVLEEREKNEQHKHETGKSAAVKEVGAGSLQYRGEEKQELLDLDEGAANDILAALENFRM